MKPEILMSEQGQKDLLLIDVRSPWEYRTGHVVGAVNLPLWKVVAAKRLLLQGGASQVVLYCEHGPRAFLAGFLLRLVGIRNIDYLDGHMMRWKNEQRPLAK